MKYRTIEKKSVAVTWKGRIGLLCCYCCMVACAPTRDQKNLKVEISRLLLERDSLRKAAVTAEQLKLKRAIYMPADSMGIHWRRRVWDLEFPFKDPPWVED